MSHPHLAGIVASLVSSIGFATMDAATKLLLATVPAGWALTLRSAAVVVLVVATFLLTGRRALLGTTAWPLVIARSVAFGVTTGLVVTAFQRLGLAETVAIYFLAPVFTILLGSLLLGEPMTRRAIVASVVGFAGVLCIAQPGSAGFTWMYALPLVAAVTGALADVLSRRLAGRAHPGTLLVYGQVAALVYGVVAMPLGPMPAFGLAESAYFGVAVAMATLGYYFVTVSFQKAPARVVAPLRYLNVVWANVYAWLIWRTVPDPLAAAGIVLVVIAGAICILPLLRATPAASAGTRPNRP